MSNPPYTSIACSPASYKKVEDIRRAILKQYLDSGKDFPKYLGSRAAILTMAVDLLHEKLCPDKAKSNG